MWSYPVWESSLGVRRSFMDMIVASFIWDEWGIAWFTSCISRFCFCTEEQISTALTYCYVFHVGLHSTFHIPSLHQRGLGIPVRGYLQTCNKYLWSQLLHKTILLLSSSVIWSLYTNAGNLAVWWRNCHAYTELFSCHLRNCRSTEVCMLNPMD